ncbi:hypothetical protein KC887_02040 [Candidatus Kaiserbacteria bacterium]|nr:hypothetical protein [Candidatus Kaiserbacteria bacterium]
MFLHEAVKESVVRGYETPDGYEKRAKPLVRVSIEYETPTCVFASSLFARVPISGADIELLRDFGRQKGIKTLRYERDGVITEEQL